LQHAVFGIVLLVLGVLGVVMWWPEFGLVLRGIIPFILLIAGLVAIGAGLTTGKLEESRHESPDKE